METLRFRFIYGRIESNLLDDDGNLAAILVTLQTTLSTYIYINIHIGMKFLCSKYKSFKNWKLIGFLLNKEEMN